MARITRQRVAFARLKSPRLEKLELDYTKEQGSGAELAAGACEGLKGALVKVAVRYREEDAARVEEQVAGLLKQVRPVARHIFPVEKAVVRKSRARDPGMTLRVSPLESFHRWLDGREVLEQERRDSLEAIFLGHVEKVGAWPEPLQAARFMVTNIEVQDYIPFEGPSVAGGLEEGVYGIVGSYQDNARRSNRAGKSALLKAVLTSLFGDDRGEAVRDIHYGRDGYRIGLDLAFDDPRWVTAEVVRFRKKLGEVACGLDGAKCSTTSLNEQLAERLCFSKEDFTKIAFVKAGDLHGIVGSGNAQMKQDLMRWLGLEGWSRVHDSIRREMLQLDADIAHKQMVMKSYVVEREGLEKTRGALPSLAFAENALKLTRASADDLAQKVVERKAGLEAGRLKREREELFGKLKLEMSPVRRGVEQVSLSIYAEQLQDEVGLLRGKRDVLREGMTEARVAAGKFAEQKRRFRDDHLCPLAQKIECPVAGKVCFSADAEEREEAAGEEARKTKKKELESIEARLEEAEREERTAANRLARIKLYRTRIEELDGRLGGMKEAAATDDLEDALEEARQVVVRAERSLALVCRTEERIGELDVQEDEVRAQLRVLAERLQALAFVQRACGRDGIPTLQMENALSSVEAGANAVLQLADAPHRVAFSFQRELKKLEDECQGCGRSFDNSEKACKRCGEERRNKKSEDISLEVIDANGRTQDFSQDSSGGKALAALALRVALAQHFGFSVLFLDEVCASLDDENLDLMVRLLNRLRSMGFDQVFVISHRQRVRDLLDRLIVVERDDALGRSRFFLQG
jgi:DNA repair exonuclease SbcCD ATPase subunit